MIDKLDLRLPADAAMLPQVREFIREGEYLGYGARSHRSQHYQSVTDLRPIGIDAILHKGLKRECNGYTGTHKLEIIDAGQKTFSGWCETVGAVYGGDVNTTSIMRVDTCSDLAGVPVSWFLSRMRVKFKRWSSGIGDSKWQAISNRGIETITAGKRPNFLRVYDKVQERLQDYRKRLRRQATDVAGHSFEELNGFSESATLSRVERQHTSRGVPQQFRCFGDLHRAPEYNPFACLEIIDGVEPDDLLLRNDLSAKETLEGIGFQTLREKWGEQSLARWLNDRSSGNYARFRRKRPYLFGTVNGSKMNQRIFEEYRVGTMRQLAA